MELRKHARFLYQPALPLGKNKTFVTNSKAHWNLAADAAAEGTVLLKNDGTLPLAPGAKICLFGLGAGDFQFGGGGSGMVFTEKLIKLSDGLMDAEKEGKLQFFAPLVDFYREFVKDIYRDAQKKYPDPMEYQVWRRTFQMPTPALPEALYQEAVAFGDTAIFCLCRYTSEGDTNGDRKGGKGDFYLWDEEEELLQRLCQDFKRVIVVCNTPGPVSMLEYKNNPKIGAVLYPLYGGGISGQVLTQILLGERYPSGHLQHTLANRLEDYPSTEGFHDSQYYVNYTEDIFVGYRYFETFAPEKVAYPYGFGLGYTTFSLEAGEGKLVKNTVQIPVRVKNTGNFPGKEVIQAYLTAPQGLLGKAQKVLCAFEKTKELQPGEETTLTLHFDIREFGSFDDLGKICESAFIMEKGEYIVSVGNNVRDTEEAFRFTLEKDMITRRCHAYMAPRALPERLTANGTMEKLPQAQKVEHKPLRYRLKTKGKPDEFLLMTALAEGREDEFIASMTEKDLGDMLYGHPMMNASNTNGIGLPPKYERHDVKYVPLVPTADGPMGLRIRKGRGVIPTFFPCENTVSQTWNLPLARKVGTAIAREAKENNIGIWLAPAMNIHRNPMCGRNFEYYSEDPLATGHFAASCVKGVQSQNIAATVKHFCCNNRENDRRLADSRVSQRALREIYLRGFEIVIKKANPWALMTSYNPVNGEQMSSNWEALNGVLRTEWNYNGVVMTDWRTLSNLEDEVHAGGDVKMPEVTTTFYENAPATCDPGQMIKDGTLDRGAVYAAVRRILRLMERLD